MSNLKRTINDGKTEWRGNNVEITKLTCHYWGYINSSNIQFCANNETVNINYRWHL